MDNANIILQVFFAHSSFVLANRMNSRKSTNSQNLSDHHILCKEVTEFYLKLQTWELSKHLLIYCGNPSSMSYLNTTGDYPISMTLTLQVPVERCPGCWKVWKGLIEHIFFYTHAKSFYICRPMCAWSVQSKHLQISNNNAIGENQPDHIVMIHSNIQSMLTLWLVQLRLVISLQYV